MPKNMKQYYFALVVPGRKLTSPTQIRDILPEHLAWVQRMADERKILIAGPLHGRTDRLAVGVLDAASQEHAESLVAEDPAAKAEIFAYEVQPATLPDLSSVRIEE